jgi:hypothetical protein
MSTESDARAALAICQSTLLLLVERRILAGEDVRQVLEDAADAQRQMAHEGWEDGDERLDAVARAITDVANSVAAASVSAEPPAGGGRPQDPTAGG